MIFIRARGTRGIFFFENGEEYIFKLKLPVKHNYCMII
jgi:hypothetical protein